MKLQGPEKREQTRGMMSRFKLSDGRVRQAGSWYTVKQQTKKGRPALDALFLPFPLAFSYPFPVSFFQLLPANSTKPLMLLV